MNAYYERQHNIDIIELYTMNRAKALKPKPAARMDHEDRLAYIREQKAKLGLNNSFLLKSSKRVVADSQLRKDMPSLEFNRLNPIDTVTLFQPHEMTWSTHEFNKQNNLDWLEEKQEERLNDILHQDGMKQLKYKEHKMRIL